MREIAAKIYDDVNATIDDPKRKISKLPKGPINSGLVRATIEHVGAKGFCFETTFAKQPISTRVRQHRIMVHRLMREIGMEPGDLDSMTTPDAPGQIRVAVYDAGGTGGSGVENMKRILEANSAIRLHHVGPADIQAGVLEQFDAVIFPGGSGKAEAAALEETGKQAVKDFIQTGGGYIGVCAGAFLATAKYDWSLALMNAKTFTGYREIPGVGRKSMYLRGKGKVKMELTEEGKAIFGNVSDLLEVGYSNGPILSPHDREELPAYIPLAMFRTEISQYEPQIGTMINTPAITANAFGEGRVITISPHPEGTPGLEAIIERSIIWVAGRTASAE